MLRFLIRMYYDEFQRGLVESIDEITPPIDITAQEYIEVFQQECLERVQNGDYIRYRRIDLFEINAIERYLYTFCPFDGRHRLLITRINNYNATLYIINTQVTRDTILNQSIDLLADITDAVQKHFKNSNQIVALNNPEIIPNIPNANSYIFLWDSD